MTAQTMTRASVTAIRSVYRSTPLLERAVGRPIAVVIRPRRPVPVARGGDRRASVGPSTTPAEPGLGAHAPPPGATEARTLGPPPRRPTRRSPRPHFPPPRQALPLT